MSKPEAEICFLRRDQNAFGGAERYLSRLSDKLTEQGYPHRLINSRLPRFLPSFMRALLYNTGVCLAKGRRFYFSLERISCPDVYRAGDGVHREFLSHKRRSYNLLNPVYLYLEKRCFNNARHIIANSQMVKDEIIHHYQVDNNKITVIYSGVSENVDTSTAGSVRSEYSIDANTPLILFVGSGFERKGVAEMLTLLSRIEKPFFALVVGKDKKLQRYLEMSEQLGLADRVRFIGQKTDIDRYYLDSDILLLPTHYEPFSNVVLEAMLYGNAVITTRQNGAAEVLQQDLIMDTPADETILPVLQKLVSEPDYLDRIKQQNMETVSGFTIEKNAAESVALIEQTLREINR